MTGRKNSGGFAESIRVMFYPPVLPLDPDEKTLRSSYGVVKFSSVSAPGCCCSSFDRMRRVSGAVFDGFGRRGRGGVRFAMPPIVARPYLQYAGAVRL